MRDTTKNASSLLFETAEGQQGYFTAKQTTDVGYRLGSQAYHGKSGNWVRAERGIYRLARLLCEIEAVSGDRAPELTADGAYRSGWSGPPSP